ncbi:MAG: hypothetical protein LBR93_03855, partial [Treponema sp.]|nr:hypothetical protein [Treponema sp.]
SFWNSFLKFSGKTGLLPVFPRACFIEPKVRTNRVLEQAQLTARHVCHKADKIHKISLGFKGRPKTNLVFEPVQLPVAEFPGNTRQRDSFM